MINNTIKVGIIGLIMLSASLFVFIPLALYFCSMLNQDSSNEQVIGGSALPSSIHIFGISIYPTWTAIILIMLGLAFYIAGFICILRNNSLSAPQAIEQTTKPGADQ